MIDLSPSGLHVAIVLDDLPVVDHHLIVGRWPSLLVVTGRASLQLDPADGLTPTAAALITGRLLREVTRWDAAIRGHSAAADVHRAVTAAADFAAPPWEAPGAPVMQDQGSGSALRSMARPARTAMMATALTRAELLVLPAVIDVVTAGKALGLGRTLAHALVRRGEFPVPVFRLGRVYRVPTAAVLELLELPPEIHTDTGPPAA